MPSGGLAAKPTSARIPCQSHPTTVPRLRSTEHLCGPIDSVMAEMTDQTGGGYRTMALALRFASGADGSMTGTYDSSYAYQDTHRLEINGTQGRLVVGDTVQRFCFQNAGN